MNVTTCIASNIIATEGRYNTRNKQVVSKPIYRKNPKLKTKGITAKWCFFIPSTHRHRLLLTSIRHWCNQQL